MLSVKFKYINKVLIHSCRHIITSAYKDIDIPSCSIAEFFFRHADLHSNRIAYIDAKRNTKYTYSDAKSCINGIASGLTKKGVKFGTMAAIAAHNSAEYLMLVYALSSIGCQVMVCNQNYTNAEIRNQLLDSRPSILFTDTENLAKVTDVISQVPSVQDVYVIGERSDSYDSVYDLMEDQGNMSPIGQIDIDPQNQVALMPYSSGTTGLPKGVMITHRNLVANMMQISATTPIVGSQTMMLNLPLYHIYGIVVVTTTALTSGSPLVIHQQFNPTEFLQAIEKHKVNRLHLVPPLILFLLNHPDVDKYDLSSVEFILCGAAPLDEVLEKRCIDKFRKKQPKFTIIQGYGMSETSPLTHIIPSESYTADKHGTIGTLVPNMRCKIVNVDTREELGSEEPGEVLLQGPNIMKGYFGKASATEATFEDGWLRTGDIMKYDKDHYFIMIDRFKELIKVKGYQVAPAEIEGLLLSHPAVADCAVIGVPHDKYGEVPKAFIVKGKEINENDIHLFISEHLSSHKHLVGGIVFVNEIPKSQSGKILRRLLK